METPSKSSFPLCSSPETKILPSLRIPERFKRLFSFLDLVEYFDWQNLMLKGALCTVENGESISLWNDSWDHLLPPRPILPSPSPQTVSFLINWSTSSWNLDPISDFLTESKKSHILATALIDCSLQDQLIWPYTNSGTFSVKSAYHLHHSLNNPLDTIHPHKYHSINPDIWK